MQEVFNRHARDNVFVFCTGINTSFDAFYENLFFWKDYVISHKNMKRNGRAINTVTKTKKTKALIEKYWWRGVDSISL